MNIKEEIIKLKKETNTLILAHSYQSPEILEIADKKGDSFALSTMAMGCSEKNVLMCGVRFMAETVKILSPEKRVFLANETAGCPMAEQISVDRILEFKEKNPNFKVVAYVNTTAKIKAISDVCVTSSSALQIVEQIDAPILFIPDKNLGTFVKSKLPHKEIVVMDGFCPVHNYLTTDDVLSSRQKHPDALFAVHPEAPIDVCDIADFVGSTTDIMNFAKATDKDVIIGTEKSISDHLSIEFPERKFPIASKKLMCPDMRITTMMDVLKALKGTGGDEVFVEEEIALKAKVSIDAMIEMGK